MDESFLWLPKTTTMIRYEKGFCCFSTLPIVTMIIELSHKMQHFERKGDLHALFMTAVKAHTVWATPEQTIELRLRNMPALTEDDD